MKYLKLYEKIEDDFEEVWEEEPEEYSSYPEYFKNFLIKYDALKYYHENLNPEKYDINNFFSNTSEDMYIGGAFSWTFTKQGLQYWGWLNSLWINYLKKLNKK